MIDYRALLAFLEYYIVFVYFFGISAIVFWLPDYQNCKASIYGTAFILFLLGLVYRDHVVNDIKIRNL
jgi:hypothetical protein